MRVCVRQWLKWLCSVSYITDTACCPGVLPLLLVCFVLCDTRDLQLQVKVGDLNCQTLRPTLVGCGLQC